MLVLTRKKDESIVIADTIVITVIEVVGNKVKIGIQAPRDVRVDRQEIYEAIMAGSPVPAKPQPAPARRVGVR